MAKLGLQQSPLEEALQQAESVSYGLPDDLKKQFEQERINAESRRKNTDQQYDARVLDLSSRNAAVTGGATWDSKLTRSTSFIKNNPDVFAGYSPQQMHWIAAISAQESAGNPNARSPVGAFGLMQVMPATGQNPGYGIKPLRDSSVRENVRLGLGKFEAMMSRFNGDVDKALAAYNAGEGNVDKAVARARKYGGDWKAYLPRPQETIPYINNVKGYYNAIGSKGGVPTSAAQPAPTKQATTADSRYRPLSETELKRMQEAQAQGLDTFIPFAGAKPIKIGQQPGKKAPKQENEDAGFLSDTGNLLLSGVNSSVEAAHEIVGRMYGISIGVAALDKIEEYFTGKTPQQIFKEVDEKYNKKLSNETAEARKKRWIIEPGDDLGNGKKATEYSFGDAWKDPRAYYAGIVESAPEMVATMGGSLTLAKGAFKVALKSGATREVAAKKAATTATIAGGLLEGGFGGAHAAIDVRKEIKGMSADILKNSEAMKALMAEGKTFEQARNQLAEDAATKAFVLAGVGTGIFGGMGDRAIAQVITKGTSSRLKSAVGGAIGEGLLEEAPQSAAQQMAQNYAVQDADPNRSLMKGVVNQAAGGAVLGGIMGGGIGAAAHRADVPQVDQPVAETPQAEEVPQAAAEAPVQDVVPEQPIQPEQPPRKVGPLERALGGEESLNTAIDNEIAAVAADQWLGAPGTVTKISPKADPESVYTVTVEGYENGEVFARDQDGTPMQFNQDEISQQPVGTWFEFRNTVYEDQSGLRIVKESPQARAIGERKFTYNIYRNKDDYDNKQPISSHSTLEEAELMLPSLGEQGTQPDYVSDEEFDALLNAVPLSKAETQTDAKAAIEQDQSPELTDEATKTPSFDELFLDAHVNNPSQKTRLIQAEIKKSGRKRSQVLADVKRIVDAYEAGQTEVQAEETAKTHPLQAKMNDAVQRYNDAVDARNQANEQGFFDEAKRQEQIALSADKEVKAIKRQYIADVQESTLKAEQKKVENIANEYLSKPIGYRYRPSEYEEERGLYWEKTASNEWTGRGDWFQKGKTRTNIDMAKAGGLIEVPSNAASVTTEATTDMPAPLMGADGNPKWFMSQDKAQAHIEKKKLVGQYEVKQVDSRRFEIHPIAAATQDTAPSNAAPSVAETETVQLETKQTVTKWKEDMQEALAKADQEHPLYKKLALSAKNGLRSEHDREVALRQAREIEKKAEAPKAKAEPEQPKVEANEQRESKIQSFINKWNQLKENGTASELDNFHKTVKIALNGYAQGKGVVAEFEQLKADIENFAKDYNKLPKTEQSTNTGPSATKTTTEKPIRTYGFDRVKMANNLSLEELDQLKRQVEAEHANPRNEQGQYLENGQPSLSLYDKKGLKKLDDISWAVYHKTKNKDGDQANVSKEADKIDTTAERVDADNTEPKQKTKAAPSANTLVSDDRAAELRARLKAKLTQLNSGIDPEIMAIGAELAVYHIERGARKFAAFAQNIADDLDVSIDKVRPYLRSWYYGARYMMEDMGGSIEGMDDAETVRAELEKLNQTPAAEQTQAPAQKAAPTNTGKTETVTTPAGREFEVRHKVVEADDLITSNTGTGAINPDYPQQLQPRDRSRAASQNQINEIASKLNPRLLGENVSAAEGAPIVSADNIVESGNGRTLAIRKAYERGLADDYRNWLAEQGYDVEGMKMPVLVRERTTPMSMEERTAYTKEANERTTLELSPAERAAMDAQKVGPILYQFKGGDIDSSLNRPFVRAFIDEVVSTSDRGGMLEGGGQLSQAGKRRIQAALLAKAYDDESLVTDMFESVDSDIKAIGGAMLDVAGEWASMRDGVQSGTISSSVDVTPNLMEAVNIVRRARAEGRSVFELVNQDDIFAGEIDPVTRGFVSVFYRGESLTRARGRDKVAGALLYYAQQALNTTPGENLFGDPEIKGSEILRNANERLQNQEADKQQDIFAGPSANEQDAREPGGSRPGPGTETANKTPAETAVSEEQLIDYGLLKDHGGKWKYRNSTESGWMTANSKDAAVERAREAYNNAIAKGETVLTRNERGEQADKELYDRMQRRYGDMTDEQLQAEYDRLGSKAAGNSSNEFDGNGGRRTGAAVSNESARTFAEERRMLGLYMDMRKQGQLPTRPALPATAQLGPLTLKPTPIGKTLYRETNSEGLDTIIRASYTNGNGDTTQMFVADNVDLAIGQGENKGVLIQFRGEAVAGTEHKKPGTGDIAGREYKTEYLGLDAVDQMIIAADVRMRPLTRNLVVRNFDREVLPNGDRLFRRKGYDVGQPLNEIRGETAPAAAPKNPFQKYDDVAQQYGRSVNEKGEILGKNGKPTGVHIVEKKQRIIIKRIEGNQLLFTAAKPEGIGKFLEDYWFDKKLEKPAEAKAAAPAPNQDKAENPNGPHHMTIDGRRMDGGPIIPGHQFITSSGRLTTPYPKQKSEKYASQWLIDNAVAEAEARGDRFNTRIFSSYKPMKNGELSTADREGMLMYLYGKQPAVVPSILKDDLVEDRNVSSTAERVERNRQEPATTEPVNAPTNGNAGTADAAGTGTAGQDTDGEPGAGQRDQRISTDGTVAGRERGDQRIHRDDGQFEPTQRPAGDTERTGGGIDGGTGSTVEQQRANDVVKNAQAAGTSELDQRLAAQAKADKTPTKWGDKASIDVALPLLLDPQREDVLKAENRLSQDNGILFTNGTGTGKTATGMGVAKRYINAGKDNIVIVVPSDKIAADWVKFAKMLNVEVKQLADSSSNGDTGPIVTTYANFGQNPSLVNRKWDLIITDESHYLSSNEKGDGTAALEQLRALTGHHAGFYAYVKQKYAKELAALDKARQAGPRGPDVPADRIAKLQDAEDKALKAWQEIQDRERPKWEARWEKQQDIPKVVMLSATPFAYVKNTDYAEGYLFHYVPPAELKQSLGQGRGYNQGGPREQFMMQHFGYRMRTGKLTAPDAGVNSQLLEQNFNQWLKDQGALSGRRLDVPFDYDRKFVLVDDAVGTKIDNALKYLHKQSMQAEAKASESSGDENAKKQAELWSNLYAVVNGLFDYQSRMYLLEAIKAKAAIPMIQKHLDLGRKVVVFHDYNKGGGFDPFSAAIGKALTADQKAFNKKVFDSRPDLFNLDLTDLVSPIEALTKAFPQALEFNGTISKANRRANADKFNKDNSEHNIIIVQSDAGREGVSLHDTSGVHQRVEINLGMPVKPVAATQIEGRIYRTGQASNAIFRYLTTGTGWESATFSRKIAERASTAENLALGLEARGLKESFIDAYQNADIHEPGEADGLGGKEYDRSMSASNAITPFDKAKTFYWAQQKNTKSRGQREGADYYATPEPVGFKMVEFADIKTGNKVLEPSAGHGAIARWFPDQTDVTMVEPSYDLAQRAGLANGTARIINDTFENLHVTNKYDAIVMNPPYGNGGKISTDHLAKAATHLRDGGRIVALLPRGGMADNRLAGFLNSEEAKDLYVVARINMPSSTFERAGTSVNTQILVLEKHKNERDATGITEKRIDLSNAKDVNELFDRMEDLTIEPRKESTSLESKYEIVEHVTQKGKVLRGIIRTDINKFTAQQIDPYAFRKKNEDGKQGWFIRERWLTPDVKFSRSDTTGTGTTVEQVRTALADRFGEKTIAELEKNGILTIVEAYDVPGVEGYSQGGKVTLVANTLTADTIVPVFLHELGGHVGMQGVMQPETYQKLMDQFNRLVEAKDPIALEAKRLAEREADPTAQDYEYLPYLITVAAREQKKRPGIRTLINRIVAAVKAWAFEKIGVNINLNANDVLALAERMVNTISKASDTGSRRFSQVDTPQSEINAVRKQYEGTDEWMKAPNGKPTNLNEQQWLQVRTPSFKNWFGDWENDPENASKVVDENGEPMVVYHGSRNSFTAFDASRLSENTGNDGHYGAGVYFSMEKAEAETYGKNIISAFLNIKAPVRNSIESLEPFAEQFGYEKEFKTVDKNWLAGEIKKKDPNAGILASLYADGYTFDNVWTEFEKRGGKYQSEINLDEIGDVFENIDNSIGYYSREFIEETIGEIPEDKKIYGYENEPDILDITDRGNAGRSFSNTIQKAGHDGVIAGSEFVVFKPEQIKSATDNTGAFDPNNPDIRFSRRDEDLAPVSEQEYASKLSQWWDETKKLPSDKITKLMTDGGLGLIPLRPMLTEMAKDIPAATSYLRIKDAMDAMRNKWHAKTDAVAQEWLKYRIKNKEENRELMDLMHESTLNQVDPSMPFQSLMTPKERMALENPGLNANLRLELTAKMELDAKREEAYDVLKSRYDSLSSEAQSIYKSVRDAYTDLADAFDETLLKNMEKAINVRIKKAEREHSREMERITDEGLQGQERDDAIAAADRRLKNAKTKIAWNRKARMTQLRKQFETQRLAGPYFPLARFGNLFVTVRDAKSGEVVSFSRFEDPTEQRQFAEEMRKDKNYKVEEGALIGEAAVRKAVDPNFVADVEDILADLPNAEQVKDEVWQRYLESLPDMSVRKSRIHRKGRAGFNADAVRAFGHHMFHGSHQLARMAHSMDLEDALDQAKDDARTSKDPKRSSLIVNEMEKRHQFIMNPTGGALAQWASSFAFVWYLAGSPKAAIMNLFQTPIMATPILGAYAGGLNGVARAGKELTKAAIDFTKGKGFAGRSSSLTAEERQAMADGYETGVIERTQGHDLAGVGETGVEYSAARERAMKIISWGFHHAERFNREVTFLAAYRLARTKGLSHESAVNKAGELTWKSHFDYSNTSRPRLMHSDTMKVLLVFRNFQINMLYRLFRDVHQAVNGESKEVRREALTHLAGITGMMMLNAGITGTWLFGIAMVMAGLFMDDGEDPDEELKKAMIKVLGPRLAGMALHGLPGYITGTSLSGSVGMPDLWFRSPDSEKEGEEALQYWQSQLLGAVPGIAAQFVSGWDKIKKGEEYRGIETMMPKMFKDPMRAYRYMTEGAKNMRGDTVAEVTNPDVIKQALGFTPARIAEQYKINNASYNLQQSIMKERKRIMDDYYKADQEGNEAKVDELIKKIEKYNEKNPEQAITPRSIIQSRKNRDKGAENAVGGMRYNSKLRDRLMEEQAPNIYDE